MDLQAVRRLTEEFAREAGAIIMQHYDQPHQERVKSLAIDITTEADTAAEAVIVARLQAAFPSHHIIGEEGGGMGAPAASAEYFWHVDPLDGTSNFANNLPFFATSIALSGRDGRPLVAAVYSPAMGELFSAARGGGATLNGRPLRVSTTAALERAILVTGFPYDAASNPDNNLAEWAWFATRTRGLRRLGSAAIDLCYVAAGRFEAYWERYIHSWDCLAGLLCVLEAGGRVTDYNGHDSDRIYTGAEIVASNGAIHDVVLDGLHRAQRGER